MKRSVLFAMLAAGMLLAGGMAAGQSEKSGAVIVDTVLVGWNNPKGDIRIPDGVTDIAEDVFANCKDITRVLIPASVVNINKGAFYKCTALRSVEIQGNGLEIIGEGAFNGDTALISIALPKSVLSIGSYAFNDCTALATLVIPENVLGIGKYAFNNCRILTTMKIPDSVMTVGDHAFASCAGLRSLTIGLGVTRLEAWTFEKCVSLLKVTIPDNVTAINGSVFSGCDKLMIVSVSDKWREGGNSFDAMTADMLKRDRDYWTYTRQK